MPANTRSEQPSYSSPSASGQSTAEHYRADTLGSSHPPQLQPPAGDVQRRPPRLMVVPVMLALNVAVFVAWFVSQRSPLLHQFLWENFVVSTRHLADGHYWTLLTSAFSQEQLWHLLFNMIVLVSFGSVLERILGRRLFVGFYLVAAVVSSASHCLVTALTGLAGIAALGASGVMSGLLLVFALLFPKHKILIFGVIPLPALVAAILFVGLDIWGLVEQSRGHGLPIGHGAHLGGALCGFLLWLCYLRPRLQRLRQQHAILSFGLTPAEAAELQRLRDKTARQGMAALTPKEQHFLQQLQQRLTRR